MTRAVVAFLLAVFVHVSALASMSLPDMKSGIGETFYIRLAGVPVVEAVDEREIQADAEIKPQDLPVTAPVIQPGNSSQLNDVSDTGGIENLSHENEVIENSDGQVDTPGYNPGAEGEGDVADFSPGDSSDESGSSGTVTGTGNAGGDEISETLDSGQREPDIDEILSRYRSEIISLINAHKVYPSTARRLRQQGEVRIGFTVLSDGSVNGLTVVASSGTSSLDSSAMDAVSSSAPLPPIPGELGRESLSITVNIVFSLD